MLFGARQMLQSIEASKTRKQHDPRERQAALVPRQHRGARQQSARLLVHDARAVRGELLRAVRRQHRSLAHPRQQRLRLARDAGARRRDDYRSKGSSTPTTTTSKKGPARRSDRTVRGRISSASTAIAAYLMGDDFALVEERSRLRVHVAASGEHQRIVSRIRWLTARPTTPSASIRRSILRRRVTSYARRWTPNDKLQAFGSFWLQRSLETSSTHFDPRLSLMYRPDSTDVIRMTGGRSYSEPDPSLLAFAPPIYGAPSSINCPSATTGTGALVSIASVANPELQPETAGDLELAYGHRFTATTNIQADVYQSLESQALLNGNVLDRRLSRHHRPVELYRQGDRTSELVPRPQSDDKQSRLYDDVQCSCGALSRHRLLDQRRHNARRYVQCVV